jgi:hypothetical protein
VAWDEPQVSVGGLLDRHFGYNFHENPKYGGYAQQKKKEDKEGEECAVKAHSGSGVHSRGTCRSAVHSKNILSRE